MRSCSGLHGSFLVLKDMQKQLEKEGEEDEEIYEKLACWLRLQLNVGLWNRRAATDPESGELLT